MSHTECTTNRNNKSKKGLGMALIKTLNILNFKKRTHLLKHLQNIKQSWIGKEAQNIFAHLAGKKPNNLFLVFWCFSMNSLKRDFSLICFWSCLKSWKITFEKNIQICHTGSTLDLSKKKNFRQWWKKAKEF